MKKLFLAFILLFTVISPCIADDSFDIYQSLQTADDIRSSNPNEFKGKIQELANYSDSFSSKQLHYFNYLNAYKLAFQGNFKESLKLWKQVVASDASPLLKFRANLSLVNILAISKNWSEGLSHLVINLETLPEIEEPEFKQLGLLVAAMFYNQLGQFELGLKYAQRLESQIARGRNYCLAKQLGLESQLELGLLEENDPQILEGIEACQQSNEVVMESAIYSYLATLSLKQGNPNHAISILESNFEALLATNYVPVLAKFTSILSEAHFDIGDLIKAKAQALQSIEYSINIGTSESSLKAYKVLFQIAESLGDHKLALEYHKKFAEADRAYLDDIKTKHLAFQLAEHQTTEHKSRIELLDKQNNLLKIERKLSVSEAENNRLFIAMLIAIITLLVFWAYKSWMTQKRLKQLAEYDALTGILNRGHFTQVAQSALKYCANTDMYLGCILFDLDKFKNINDSYGHACGDWVLKRVAEVCQAQGRKNDIFARLGGEEFCVVLPSCDLLTATKLAEEYRKIIERIDSADSGFDFTISASFGVTDTLRSGHALEKLIADADEAMYESKHNGRNRITVYSVPDEDADSDKNTAANSGGAQADLPLFTGS